MNSLNDYCELIVDCEHKTAPIQETGYPSIRTPNIGHGFFILDGVNRVSEATYTDWTKRAVPLPGDLILAREAPVGNVAVIPEEQQFCLGQRTVLLRPDKSKAVPDYLCYLLLTPLIRGQLLSKSGGATVHHLNMKDIRALHIGTLPNLSEQAQTASVIKTYDDLIETNRRRIALLEESARLLYREWFVNLRFPGHELVKWQDGLPEGWRKCYLKDITTLNYGKALKESNRTAGEVPVYGSSGIVGTHNKSLVDGPAIIVGRKGNVGSVFFSDVPCFAIDTVYFVSGSDVSYYLFHLLKTMNFISSDAAVPGLNRNYAYGLEVLHPDASTLTSFEQKIAPVFQQISLLKRQNTALQNARDELLPNLMSGAIRV
ncbi:MAG: restriction endonuclease subunit S [Methylococcaceae bacterium]|nr:restriction endonuclease subunit S [Methylococcaceae bacterium]MDZ4156946.1 restriction endonuclease subunit S [Methylococcales bacterium]MDP2394006.1 restriction endonuclease subunit S [Methylococcaceae bacterium]MDP3018530.1 restriction endonuclease subunit S [Methylococcaceae bacterium]MDP3390944.1 restriction endonuclease subunit S [Methylococcaceae bacterium]